MSHESRDESLFGAVRPTVQYDHGRAPLMLGIAWFAAVLLAAFGLWLVDFKVDETVQKAAGYSAVAVVLLLLLRGTPSTRLAHEARARRDARRFSSIAGAMTALLLLGVFVAAFNLNTWDDWLVLGVLALLPVGFGIMLNTRFTMGRY